MSQKSAKILLFSLLAVALLLAVTPVLISRNIRDLVITNPLGLLPPDLQAQVRVNESSFTGGWLRSHALLELEYLPLGGLPLKMQLDMAIQHGPVLFTNTGPAFGLAYAHIVPTFDNQELRELLEGLPFVLPDTNIHLQVGLTGTTAVNLDIAPMDHADANGTLEFGGLQAAFVAYADESATFNLTMGRLSARESGSSLQFSIDSLELASTTNQISDMLAPSAMHLHIPALDSDAPYPFNVADLTLESRIQPSIADAQNTDIYQRVQVGQITSDFPLTSFTLTGEINETRGELLRRYYGLLIDVQNEMNSNGGVVSAQVTQSAEAFALLLLQNRIVVNNSLNADAYGGDHSADLRVLWRGLPTLGSFAQLDLREALAALELTLDLSLDLEAIMRSPLGELVDPYVQEGYLVLDNGRILSRATLLDSELVLNGERIALDNWF